MKKILLKGYYGFGNAGDDALLYSIIKRLKVHDTQIDVLSKYPLDSNFTNEINNLKLNNINLFKTVFNADVVIYGGGSQLQDFGTLKNKLTLLRSLFLNWITKLRKKKVIYLGVSIGPVSSKTGRILIEQLMKTSDLLWVRDQRSYDFLQTIKKIKSKNFLSPDLVLSLETEHIKNIKKNNEKKIFGINLMPHFNKIEVNKEIESTILENISKIIEEHSDVSFKFFQFQNSSQMNDELMYNKLSSFLEERSQSWHIEYIKYKNIHSLLIELNKCDFFIGMRLHSAVLCDTLNIPHILLSYHPKGEGYAKLLDYNESMLIDCKKEKDFKYKIDNLIFNSHAYMKLEETNTSKKLILDSFDTVNKLIKL